METDAYVFTFREITNHAKYDSNGSCSVIAIIIIGVISNDNLIGRCQSRPTVTGV